MHRTAARLTPREREIAGLIGRGYTNRQIGLELSISERTVGAHVQNMLNKLTASNRAQIAILAADATPLSVSVPASPIPAVQQPRRGAVTATLGALLLAVSVVVAATDDGRPPVTASTGAVATPPPEPLIPGDLVYEANLSGDGAGFQNRYVIGDPHASAVTFSTGAIVYAVTQPGGNTGSGPEVAPMKRYYVDVTMQVEPGSGISFWLHLDAAGPRHPGSHEVAIDTWKEELELIYFVENHDPVRLSDPVRVDGLQRGRSFRLAALVDPPHYVVFLDGLRVIDLRHMPGANFEAPGFGVFGEDTGSVRITSIRVYSPA